LPAEQRQIIALSDYVGLSYAEIAAVMDVPHGTVMSRLHRARLALRKELAPNE
jgi:RNA polymerase sigma-70 factor (ECF subfamily)